MKRKPITNPCGICRTGEAEQINLGLGLKYPMCAECASNRFRVREAIRRAEGTK
jgi:hypothetical protein